MRICTLLLLCCCGHLFAQDTVTRQFFDDSATDYLQHVDKYSMLYYGVMQKTYLRALNHPYLQFEDYTKTRLSYLHVIYPEVMLRLDLNRDELIVKSPENHNIVLFPENVDFAEMYDYQIIYFRSDTLPGCPPPGYYILLHSGKYKVMEKQKAVLWEQATTNGIERSFVHITRYYVLMDGIYYNVKNKNGLLKVLSP